MAPLAKCLLSKHKDLSSDPQSPKRSQRKRITDYRETASKGRVRRRHIALTFSHTHSHACTQYVHMCTYMHTHYTYTNAHLTVTHALTRARTLEHTCIHAYTLIHTRTPQTHALPCSPAHTKMLAHLHTLTHTLTHTYILTHV